MNYIRIYKEFIADRRLKESLLKKDFERHHIIPKCKDGNNSKENLIKLTYEDHLFAHILLAKIYGGILYLAVWHMLNTKRYSGRRSRFLYSKFARMRSEALKGNKHALGKRHFGKKPFLGKKHTAEWIEALKKRNKNNKYALGKKNALGVKHTDEWKKNKSEGMKKYWSDPEKIKAQSERSKKIIHTEAGKLSTSIKMKAYWSNPENRLMASQKKKALTAQRHIRREFLDSLEI